MGLQQKVNDMKKILCLILAGMLLCFGARAQYKVSSGNIPAGLEIIQLDKVGDVVRIYFKWTAPEDNYGFDVDDDIFVNREGEYRRYKLVAVGNIPKTSDSAFSVASKAGDAVYFFLDFEAFPLEAPFEILEDSENDSNINVHDLVVADAGVPRINAEAFVKEHAAYLKGEFAEEGVSYTFWNHAGMALIAHYETVETTFADTFVLHLAFANSGSSPIQFDPSMVKIEHEAKNGRRTPLKQLSEKDYLNRIKAEQGFNTFGAICSVLSMAESVGQTVTGGQLFNTVSFTHNPLSGYVGFLNSKAGIQKYGEMLKNMQGQYLTAGTIPAEGALGGMVGVNPRKGGVYQITVSVADHEFTFAVDEK